MATGAYDPYQVMMKTREPVQGPDVAGASTTIANLGNYINNLEASNREADREQTKLMIEESRQASQDMFKIQEMAAARRQQDFENTMSLMKMASEAKRDELELKARNLQIQTSELAFNDQLSRIQSRTAYQQFAPLMIKAMADDDVVKYNELFSQVSAIPGVFADPEAASALLEHANFIKSYQIETPEGTMSLSELSKKARAGDVNAFKSYANLAGFNPDTFVNDPLIRQTYSAVFEKHDPASLSSFISYKTKVVPPEEAEIRRQIKLERMKTREAEIAAMSPSDREMARQQDQFNEMLDSLYTQANGNPEGHLSDPLQDTPARAKAVQMASRTLTGYMDAAQQALVKANARVEQVGAADFTDPTTIKDSEKELARKILRGQTTGKLTTWDTRLFNLGKESAKRKAILESESLRLEDAIANLQDPSALTPDLIDSYINQATDASLKMAPVFRSIGMQPLMVNKFFNRPWWDYLRAKRESGMSSYGGMTGGMTIPSTPAPQTDIPFETK